MILEEEKIQMRHKIYEKQTQSYLFIMVFDYILISADSSTAFGEASEFMQMKEVLNIE